MMDRRRFLLLALVMPIMLGSLGCVTFPPPGKVDGSHYLNEGAGYSFVIPNGWKASEPPLKAPARQTKIEIALRTVTPLQGADGSQSMILVGVSLVRIVFVGGHPWLGPYTEPEHKTSIIGAWFPGIPASERERMRVEGVGFAAGRFITFSGPPVCSSIDERLEERATTRPWNAVAVLNTRDLAFLFLGNLCDPAAEADFDKLLTGVRLVEKKPK